MAESIFKRMAGEAVAEGMWSHTFGKSQAFGVLFDEQFYRTVCKGCIPHRTWKQPSHRTVIAVPVFCKDLQVFVT